MEEILAASVEQLAEGPDQVKAQVQDILGLRWPVPARPRRPQ
jgi:hypothetical protein